LKCCFVPEQVIIYNVGLIPSQFYKCLGDKDKDAFQALILHALGLVVAVAFVSINKCIMISCCLFTTQCIIYSHGRWHCMSSRFG